VPVKRADELTAVVDEVFRVNGHVLAAGDSIAAAAGIRASSWQILGRLADEGSMTVSELARRRGLRRQSVQETVNRLVRDGLVAIVPNAADRRAPNIQLLDNGRDALATIEPARAGWAENAGGDLTVEELRTLAGLLRRFRGGGVSAPV
jgi:DNA-binding MarR family transcriptional regulator